MHTCTKMFACTHMFAFAVCKLLDRFSQSIVSHVHVDATWPIISPRDLDSWPTRQMVERAHRVPRWKIHTHFCLFVLFVFSSHAFSFSFCWDRHETETAKNECRPIWHNCSGQLEKRKHVQREWPSCLIKTFTPILSQWLPPPPPQKKKKTEFSFSTHISHPFTLFAHQVWVALYDKESLTSQ